MGTIIVATDGSDAAVKAAETGFELARQTGDAVTIVVVREILRGSLGLPFAYYDQQLFDEYHAKAERVLEAAVGRYLPGSAGAGGGRPWRCSWLRRRRLGSLAWSVRESRRPRCPSACPLRSTCSS